jgi:hydroxypyruvate isomerase
MSSDAERPRPFALSACIELLFAEEQRPVEERIRAAGAAGCEAVELWTWRDKPLDALAAAATEAGMEVTMTIVEPQGRIVDPACHEAFLAAVADSVVAATRIGCRALAVTSGLERPEASAEEQDDAIAAALRDAAPIAAEHGVTLLLEPLNTRVEHPGTYLSSTTHGLDLVERVGRPEVRLLYDLYHSVMMGEPPEEVLAGRGHLIGHVHVADSGGRHEPGTGEIDWPRALAALRAAGYRGPIGLEYIPTVESAASMRVLQETIDALEVA